MLDNALFWYRVVDRVTTQRDDQFLLLSTQINNHKKRQLVSAKMLQLDLQAATTFNWPRPSTDHDLQAAITFRHLLGHDFP